ncbi:MAG: sigma-54 dependent transcriptional regulator [Calditrichia bacterium]|nr:sigma-54-dependent Fis family transcriptional regulator [Calditrichota bacterium]MCB0270383.1 sigma-54-dependent Fis family transcriptional regulator [Calditrichota bacterium]MCB9067667.1 sigma-54-dependent Fis family transcriptional regulator [Calditrichia bacterium]
MNRVLIVDDERNARRGLGMILKSMATEAVEAEHVAAAKQQLQVREFDLAIVDLRLPDEQQGLGLVAHVRQTHPKTPVLVMTAYGSFESAVKAMKAGAQDYITKDFSRDEIVLKVEKLLETRKLWLANMRLSEKVQHLQDNLALWSTQDQIIGESPVIRKTLDLAARAGEDNESTVLITGESGTGKELIARTVHLNSATRSREKFVVVDVANMPASLLESQLFGHEKGAFTNAHQQHIGMFERANKGTVFLDEIGDFPLELQVKLLRFLQEKMFYRVGGSQPVFADVRIVAATNKNLEEMVRDGNFREDLYYRLNVVRIHLPPLRQRREDIAALIEYFRKKLAQQKGRELVFGENIIRKLQEYNWPGNIRQLKNMMERLYIICPGQEVQESDLVFYSLGNALQPSDPFDGLLDLPIKEARQQLIENFEKRYIRHYLERYSGNISKVAEIIGESREGLSKKIKRYGLKDDDTS